MTTPLDRLLQGKNLAPQAERELILQLEPALRLRVCQYFAGERRRLRGELSTAQKARAAAEQELLAALAPPWVPGLVLRVYGGEGEGQGRQLDVVAAGRRQLVNVCPELADQAFAAGDDVFLSRELNVVVGRDAGVGSTGHVSVVAEIAGDAVVLEGSGDEESVALCAASLSGALAPGDRVLCRAEFPLVVERLGRRSELGFVSEPVPDVSFDDVGGLDDLVGRIRRHLDLHLLHREHVAAYQLETRHGMVLAGPPGVGKTLVAKATANYVARHGGGARFLSVPPGALRAMYYGQAEARIRGLFTLARQTPGICVMYFDELDSFGRRGGGIGSEIDSRVLGAFLAELDGIGSADNVLCIAATNRLDLVDAALLRGGRFGDAIYEVPRPGRTAARQILACYLRPDLPYQSADAASLVEACTSWLFAPEGGAGVLAMATLANSDQHEVRARDVLSGALLASSVETAKHAAAWRQVQGGGPGLSLDDVIDALDDALLAEARKLESASVARETLAFPGAHEIVHVTLPADRLRRQRVLRAA